MATTREQLVASVAIRARSIKDVFEGLSHQEFPHTVLEDVARVPQEVADEVISKLPNLLTVGNDPATESVKERELKWYGIMLEQVHLVGEFLESSSVLAIPASYSLFLEDIISPLLPDGKLILRADNTFGYFTETLAGDVNAAIKNSRLTHELPEPLALFRFPAAAKDDALLHTILAHELGHFLDESKNIINDVYVRVDPAIRQAARDEMANALQLDVKRTTDVWVLNNALSLMDNWVMELICDVVGAHAMGPAFAMAALEYLEAREDLNAGSRSHPPATIRLHVVEEELKALGWMDELQTRNIWETQGPYVARSAKPTWPLDDRTVEVLASNVEKFLPAIQASVRDLFNGQDIDVGEYLNLEPEMRELIQNQIPPGEKVANDGSAMPFDPRYIAIASWLFWRENTPAWPGRLEEPGGLEEVYEKRLLLSRLMLKAFEISRIRRGL